jgi:hypothetical protein
MPSTHRSSSARMGRAGSPTRSKSVISFSKNATADTFHEGCGRFHGVETARVMGRLYAAARLYVNFFQPSFKLRERRREGAKVIKRYHPPSTPYERALAHPKVTAETVARSSSLAGSARALGQDSRNPGGTRQSRRSSCRTGARPANREPRTGAPVGPIRPGFACRPSSTRISLRSRAGSPSSHS